MMDGCRFASWWIRALGALVLMAWMGATAAAEPTHDPDHLVVAVVSAADDVTISGQVRTATPVRLRLYRLRPDGVEVLVSETEAACGESPFEFVDSHRPAGDTVYHLRVVDRRGVETTLASAVCIDPHLTTVFAFSSTAPRDQLAGIPSTAEPPAFARSKMELDEAVPVSSWVPGPDPPVPRS